MKPNSKYVFEQIPETPTRYLLREHTGTDIPQFPAVWVQKGHPHRGEKYITFRETQADHCRSRYSHSLSLEKNRMFTSLNFTPEFPGLSWGDYGNDAVLIHFSDDGTILTLLFFEGMRLQAYSLFERWISGELVETVEAEIVSIPAKQE